LNFCRYPLFGYPVLSLCLNCCVSRFIQLLFSLSKIVCNFTQLWKDLIFHHIFSLCLLSLFVYLILFPIQFSMINRRSEPAFKLDVHRAFKLLKISLESLKSRMNLRFSHPRVFTKALS